jgi:hypothetical protein
MDDWTSSESLAIEALSSSLAEYEKLAKRYENLFLKVFEEITQGQGRATKAAFVASHLLALMVTDLHVVVSQVRTGYCLQGMAVATGMFERAQLVAYIGDDEARAIEWGAHTNTWDWKPRKMSIKKLIEFAVRAMPTVYDTEADVEDQIDRRLHQYRDLNMGKHGNPDFLRKFLGESVGDTYRIYHGSRYEGKAQQVARWVVVQALDASLLALTFFVHQSLTDDAMTRVLPQLQSVGIDLRALRLRHLPQTPTPQPSKHPRPIQ